MQIRSARLGSGRGRRLLVAGALLAGMGGVGVAALAGPAGAQTTSSGSSGSSATPSCPAASTSSGDVAFSGVLSNVDVKIGGSNSITGISGSLCGTLDTTTMTYTIPKSSIRLSPANDMFWGFLPFSTTETVNNSPSGSLTISGTDYTTSMQMSITAVTNILWAFPCTIGPLTPTLTTGTSGSLKGTPLVGSLVTQLKGSLVSSNFSVPAIQASSSCPSIIAGLGNLLSGFPLTTGTSITADAVLTPVLSTGSSAS